MRAYGAIVAGIFVLYALAWLVAAYLDERRPR